MWEEHSFFPWSSVNSGCMLLLLFCLSFLKKNPPEANESGGKKEPNKAESLPVIVEYGQKESGKK